jgi:NAD+ synthase (glutamine-hydrolysing)
LAAQFLGVPAGRIANACSLLYRGQIEATVHKLLLPNYDVFDERRYFLPAESAAPIEFQGIRLGVHICEDAWYGEPGTTYHLSPENRNDPKSRVAQLRAEARTYSLLADLNTRPRTTYLAAVRNVNPELDG